MDKHLNQFLRIEPHFSFSKPQKLEEEESILTLTKLSSRVYTKIEQINENQEVRMKNTKI